MQINSTTTIPAIAPLDRQGQGGSQLAAKPQDQDAAQAAVKAIRNAKPEEEAPKVFTPAPPLRPNIQDYVDINRTLMAARGL